MKEDLYRKLGVMPVKTHEKKVREFEASIGKLKNKLLVAESKAVDEAAFSGKLQEAFDLAMKHMPSEIPTKYLSIGYWISQAEIKEKEEDQKLLKNEPNFSSLPKFRDRDVQTILRYGDIENHDLAVALSDATGIMLDTVFRNLSRRLGAMIKEDIEYSGPFRQAEIEEAQIKISKALRKLIDENKVVW